MLCSTQCSLRSFSSRSTSRRTRLTHSAPLLPCPSLAICSRLVIIALINCGFRRSRIQLCPANCHALTAILPCRFLRKDIKPGLLHHVTVSNQLWTSSAKAFTPDNIPLIVAHIRARPPPGPVPPPATANPTDLSLPRHCEPWKHQVWFGHTIFTKPQRSRPVFYMTLRPQAYRRFVNQRHAS